MPRDHPATHVHPSSFLTLLSGWVQQGVENVFATERVFVDLAMRKSADAMKSLREGVSAPEHSPVAILTELTVEGTSSFIEAQRILLNLAQHENEIVMGGVKERVAASVPATATTDLVRRTIDTFIDMHKEFLKITSKQTLDWLEQTGKGKYGGTHTVDLAREALGTFVDAQKKFLDVIAHETTRMTSGKSEKAAKVVKKTELAKLARDASNAFIEVQKKLLDIAGQQMNVNLKAATRALEVIKPFRLLPMANITGEGVKKFVDAEKAMITSMIKPRPTEHRAKRARRPRKSATPHAAHAAARCSTRLRARRACRSMDRETCCCRHNSTSPRFCTLGRTAEVRLLFGCAHSSDAANTAGPPGRELFRHSSAGRTEAIERDRHRLG